MTRTNLRTLTQALLGMSIAVVGCTTNPTVDPGAQLEADGMALKADGTPLANVDIQLIKFYDGNAIPLGLEPSVDDLFDCGEGCAVNNIAGLNLSMQHVMSARTGADGSFNMKFTGQDIAAPGGITDAMGNVEGGNLILVVKDPDDGGGRAGVFTRDHIFSGADFTWNPGDLQLWDAGATVSFDATPTTGLVDFTWNKLESPANQGKNFYRLEVAGATSARLIVRCRANDDVTLGGCGDRANDGLGRNVGAFSLFNYYSDAGMFNAYVMGNGANYNFRSKFTIPPMPIPMPTGNPAGIAGIWAVGTGSDQELKNTKADDGNVETREAITNNARAIYVKFESGAEISDAGILGSIVKNAYDACVTIDTNTSVYDTIGEAKMNTQGWTAKGKFCGGNGSDNALSALINFNPKQLTPWMRFTIDAGDSTFQEVGEVAAFSAD